MSLATKNQENLIHEIAITLAVHEPVNLSKLEAGRWISNHIEDYGLMLEQLKEIVEDNMGFI